MRRPTQINNYQTLFHILYNLKRLSAVLVNGCENTESRETLKRRFDVLAVNVNEMMDAADALDYIAREAIPTIEALRQVTSYVNEVAKYQDNSDYEALIMAYQLTDNFIVNMVQCIEKIYSPPTTNPIEPPRLVVLS